MFWIEFVSNKECFNDMDIVGCPKNLNKEIRKLFFKEEGINIILILLPLQITLLDLLKKI